MKQKMKMLVTTAALAGSGGVLAHTAGHEAFSLSGLLVHFLSEHGYLMIGMAGIIGILYLVRSRRT